MEIAHECASLFLLLQLITEKVFNGEKSKFNDDFTEMEKKTDATAEMVEDIQQKTKEFLQPNPAARAKMVALKLSSGQAKSQYPQSEGLLGNAMVGHGKKMGESDPLGDALIETGDSLKQIADVKYSLDNNVKQNFLEPLQHLLNNDIKEVMVMNEFLFDLSDTLTSHLIFFLINLNIPASSKETFDSASRL